MKISDIKKWWPLGEIKQIRAFAAGAINKSFLVKARGGDYVLRIYRRKTAPEIGFELALLSHLRGLPVPRVVWANPSPAIIYKYLPGKSLTRPTRAQREQVGRFLAAFHRRGQNFQWRGNRKRLYDFPKQKRLLFLKTVKQARVPYQDRFIALKKDVESFSLDPKLPSGPIHVDIKPENVLFNKGKLNGVIDFDNACLGPFILDLAKSMVWFGLDGKKFNLARAADIYHGYIKRRDLTDLEYQQLYRAIKFAFASHLFVDFYMWAIAGIPAKYFNWLMQNFYSAYQSFSQTPEEFYALL